MPDQFEQICRRYNAAGVQERERIARFLMTKTALEPAFAHLVVCGFPKAMFSTEPLFHQLAGAYAFANGDLESARDLFRELANKTGEAFNILCFVRVLLAMRKDAEAIAVLERATAGRPRDLFLMMELSTTHFRAGDIDKANATLDPVKDQIADEGAGIASLQAEIDAAIDGGLLAKPAGLDIYTESFVTDTWWHYWRCYYTFNQYQEGGASLDHWIRHEAAAIIERLGTVSDFVDFGAFCGYTIAKLAAAFPHVRFVGIDRPAIAKQLNDRAFSADNLAFIAGDTLHEIKHLKLGSNPILFHSRTACFCYPEYLRQLYARARAAGVRHILHQEGGTFSRKTMRYYRPGEFPRVSMAGRGKTFMHDYKRLLNDAGYEIAATVSVQPTILLDDRSGFGANHCLVHACA